MNIKKIEKGGRRQLKRCEQLPNMECKMDEESGVHNEVKVFNSAKEYGCCLGRLGCAAHGTACHRCQNRCAYSGTGGN